MLYVLSEVEPCSDSICGASVNREASDRKPLAALARLRAVNVNTEGHMYARICFLE